MKNWKGEEYQPVTRQEYGEYHNLSECTAISAQGTPYTPITQEKYRESHEKYMELLKAIKLLTGEK